MAITRKTLLVTAAVVAVLFLVALPLGDAHHGIGAHHKVVADVGNVVFGAFLIGAVVLVLLTLVSAVQTLLRRRSRS